MDWWAFIELVAAVVLGGWITRRYSKRASKQLEREARQLKKQSAELQEQNTELEKLVVLVIRGLEEAGLAKFNRDAQGKIAGMVVEASAHAKSTSNASLDLRVMRREDAEPTDESGENDTEADNRG